jgi:hypothetical protein
MILPSKAFTVRGLLLLSLLAALVLGFFLWVDRQAEPVYRGVSAGADDEIRNHLEQARRLEAQSKRLASLAADQPLGATTAFTGPGRPIDLKQGAAAAARDAEGHRRLTETLRRRTDGGR